MEPHDLLRSITDTLEKLRIQYFVTGSIVSIFYGEPRLTNDIDIVADVKEEHIKGLLKELPRDEFYLSEEAVRNAVRNKFHFNIIHPSSGFKIDVIIPEESAFNDSRFKRAKKVSPTKETEAVFSSPEDVVIMKMRFYKEGESEKHLRDITGILTISGEEIDKKYIEYWVEKLDLRDIWNRISEKLKKS